MYFVFSRTKVQLCCGSPCAPSTGAGVGTAVCELSSTAGAGTFPGSTQLAAPRVVTGVQPWHLQLPGSTETASESWRGKGLKSFPFTLRKYARNTWKRKGHQECCWEERQLFVFCPPTEYNLFKYLHVLLLKDFPFLPVLFWLLSYEWWRWRDL